MLLIALEGSQCHEQGSLGTFYHNPRVSRDRLTVLSLNDLTFSLFSFKCEEERASFLVFADEIYLAIKFVHYQLADD
jgi:hypothetical protein